MATRLYPRSTGTPAITPAYNGGSIAWENTAGASRYPLSKVQGETGFLTISLSRGTGDGTAWDGLIGQWVSPALGAQSFTTAQTFKGQFRTTENFGSADMRLQVVIWVAKPDGTSRGILYSGDAVSAIDVHEFPVGTPITNRKLAPTTTPTNFTANVTSVDGDYLVMEVGYRSFTVSSSRIGQIEIGGNSGTDLSEDETSTTQNNPWVEFSPTIAWSSPAKQADDTGSGTDTAAIANPSVSTSETGAGTDSAAVGTTKSVSDAGAGSDGASINAQLAVADAGTGTDHASVNTGIAPLVFDDFNRPDEDPISGWTTGPGVTWGVEDGHATFKGEPPTTFAGMTLAGSEEQKTVVAKVLVVPPAGVGQTQGAGPFVAISGDSNEVTTNKDEGNFAVFGRDADDNLTIALVNEWQPGLPGSELENFGATTVFAVGTEPTLPYYLQFDWSNGAGSGAGFSQDGVTWIWAAGAGNGGEGGYDSSPWTKRVGVGSWLLPDDTQVFDYIADSVLDETTTTPSSADTGSGSDNTSMRAAQAASESASGTDAASSAARAQADDTSAGSDGSFESAALSAAEIGVGVDSSLTIASASASETGTGTDGGAQSASVAASEDGTGSDSSSLVAALQTTENGSGSDDVTSPVALVSADETATSFDSATIGTPIELSDSGSGSDGTSVVASPLSSAETGSGADAASARAAVSGGDTGGGTDGTAGSARVQADETPSGTDNALLVAVLSLQDNVLAGDGVSIVAFISAGETGGSFEGSSVNARIEADDDVDSADGVDVYVVGADRQVTLDDSGLGFDTAVIRYAASCSDTGTGLDSANTIEHDFEPPPPTEMLMQVGGERPQLIATSDDKPRLMETR